MSESLANLGADVTAIDPSEEIVKEAASHSRNNNVLVNYLGGYSIEDYVAKNPSQVGTFDVICILEVIEHATDPSSLIEAASQLLSKNGVLFISTLNRTPKSFLFGIVGAEYILGKLPVGTHDWNQFKTPGEVEDLLRSVSAKKLSFLDTCGMVFTPSPLSPGLVQWSLDPNDLNMNWIGAYGFDTTEESDNKSNS